MRATNIPIEAPPQRFDSVPRLIVYDEISNATTQQVSHGFHHFVAYFAETLIFTTNMLYISARFFIYAGGGVGKAGVSNVKTPRIVEDPSWP